MPIRIEMPRLSDTMEEGTLLKWHVKVGDTVKSDDLLADVETDKATQELRAFDDGTVAKLAAEEGATLAVGAVIMILAEDGESVEDAAADMEGQSSGSKPAAESKQAASGGGNGDSTTATAVAEAPSAKAAPQQPATAPPPADTGTPDRVRISPVARKLADERGLNIAAIKGTGPGGRIVKRDVENAPAGGTAAPPLPATQGAPTAAKATLPPVALEAKSHPLTNMRKTIAKRLVESKTTVPHFTVTVAVAADSLMETRASVNTVLESQGYKLSVNDFIVRATAQALMRHPIVNSMWAGETIEQHGTVNMGIAVALSAEKGGGLVVPTLRDVQNMTMQQINSETKRLAKKARGTGLSLEEMSDGTFTISNLGMFGVDHFEAIINPPQAAILAVGAAVQQPVVRDGQLAVGHVMELTGSFDHRVVDGATAAEFLATLRWLLENPAGTLV